MLKKCSIIITTVLSIIIFFMLPNMAMANTIEYRGEAEGIVTTSEDFFADFGELMPGDKMAGKAVIKNTTKDKIEVFFKTEEFLDNENYDEIDKSLLQKINLRIDLKKKNEETNIYEGNLGAEYISKEYISLGTYEKGFDGEFEFEIEIPKELKNAYSLSRIEVKWIFYVVKEGDTIEPEPNDNKSDTNNNIDTNKNTNSDNIDKSDAPSNTVIKNNENKNDFIDNVIKNVKTGDYIYYVILIIILVCIVNIVLSIRRKSKNEKK